MEYRWRRHRMRFQRMNHPHLRRFRRRYRPRRGCLVLLRHHHRAIPSSFPCLVRKRSSSRSLFVSAGQSEVERVHVQGTTVRIATYTSIGVSTVRVPSYPLGSIPDLAISSACSLSGVRAGHTRNDHHHRKPLQSLLYPHRQHFH